MTLAVDIWSDIACPWCFVGKRRLETAARNRGVALKVTWHSFELDPRKAAPEMQGLSYVERLAKKYGVPTSHAQNMIDQMTATGRDEGISFSFDKAVAANTFDAHRVLHFAQRKEERQGPVGLQDRLKERFLSAHLCEGRDIADADCLAQLAAEVGLDGEAVTSLLASDDFSAEVRADEAAARELEVRGVPFFVIGRYAVGGAQSASVFESVFEKALAEQEEGEGEVAEGAACTPEGC